MREDWVSLPASYANDTYLPQAYPVVYMLDGSGQFCFVSGVLDGLSGHAGLVEIPELILIGVVNTDRNRDLTPTPSMVGPSGEEIPPFASTGGADTFADFLSQELMPAVDAQYRTRPDHTLIGHSFGGLFGAHVLLERPEMFQRVLLLDPSACWDERYIVGRAEELSAPRQRDASSCATTPRKLTSAW